MRPRRWTNSSARNISLGPGKLLRRMLEADRLTSVIFYGPPGTGKTTLAQLIASYTKSHFVRGQRRRRRRQGSARRSWSRQRAARNRPADGPFSRRNPPLRPGPAGYFAGRRREGGIILWWARRRKIRFLPSIPRWSAGARFFSSRPSAKTTSASCSIGAVADKDRGYGD